MNTKRYTTWDKSYEVWIEDGRLLSASGGVHWQDLEWQGDGLPCACQAVRQSLLLGNDEVMFGIKGINCSYNHWSSDPFWSYDIDILKGTKEEVRAIFYDRIIDCSDCCGCGDW